MNILETVTGSNQRLIQPQTVGKKAGAPIICEWTSARVSHNIVYLTYKYSVQCFWVVCGSQHTRILHVLFQIPKLSQTNARNVDNVAGGGNGYLRARAFESRTKGHDETEEIVVQGEEGYELRRCRELLVTRKAILVFLRLFLIFGDILAVEVLYHVDVDRNASFVSTTGPLWVLENVNMMCRIDFLYTNHGPGLLIELNIEVLVQLLHFLLLEPLLCVGELANSALDVELSCTEIPATLCEHMGQGSDDQILTATCHHHV